MNDKTQAGQPATTRALRTGNTSRAIRNAIEDIRDTLDYRNSQKPGESLADFLARQSRNSVTACKALPREAFTVQAETILLGRVSK